VVRYGPFALPAAAPDAGHHGTEVPGLNLNVEKPCTDCYITGMQADLVKANGARAGYSNGVMLHHMLLFNRDTGRTDATCGSSMLGLLGQRFFASGDERTPTIMPRGFGYRIGATSSWTHMWELMTMSSVPETVYVQVTFDWVPGSTPGMTNVEPVWLDVDQCGDSEVDVPAGRSSVPYTWTVNRPGNLVGIGGHLHDYGVNLPIRNDTTGQLICDSVAAYGEDPLYIDSHGMEHISSMSSCGNEDGTPLATLANDQRVTITANYDAPEPAAGVMGISVGYIAQGGGGGNPGGAGCVRATNQQHVQAGRATTWLLWAWARGSNQYLGSTWATTSLREGPAGTWTMVTAC
jgi:Stress up-regulated Nod 19